MSKCWTKSNRKWNLWPSDLSHHWPSYLFNRFIEGLDVTTGNTTCPRCANTMRAQDSVSVRPLAANLHTNTSRKFSLAVKKCVNLFKNELIWIWIFIGVSISRDRQLQNTNRPGRTSQTMCHHVQNHYFFPVALTLFW